MGTRVACPIYFLFFFQTYGQYWMEEEGCECGPFVIEPLKNDSNNPNITMREIKLTYEQEVCNTQSPNISMA